MHTPVTAVLVRAHLVCDTYCTYVTLCGTSLDHVVELVHHDSNKLQWLAKRQMSVVSHNPTEHYGQ